MTSDADSAVSAVFTGMVITGSIALGLYAIFRPHRHRNLRHGARSTNTGCIQLLEGISFVIKEINSMRTFQVAPGIETVKKLT